MRAEINPQKKYQMPNNIVIREIDDKILIISPDSANWLLLHNDRQLNIYNALAKGVPALDVIKKFPAEDVVSVLTELEAKQFETNRVNSAEQVGMYIYLTNNCNERCRHCYMFAGKKLKDELTTKEIITLLGRFVESGGEVVTFTGGEATLRDDFWEIIPLAKKLGLKSCLLTNGLSLTQSFVDKLRICIDEIQISLDGYDRTTYQYVRQVDAFEQVISGIEYSVKAGIRTIVAITPLYENLLQHSSDYIALAQNLQTLYGNYNFFVKFSKELLAGRTINPNDDYNKQYKKEISRIIRTIAPFSQEEGFAIDHRRNVGFFNCGYGWPTIAANGNVYGCNVIGSCALQGNIRNDSWSDIWQRLKIVRAASCVDNLKPCSTCDLKLLCGGGCRIKNFAHLVGATWSQLSEIIKNKPAISRQNPCLLSQKEGIYKMMIKANRLFYR